MALTMLSFNHGLFHVVPFSPDLTSLQYHLAYTVCTTIATVYRQVSSDSPCPLP